MVKITIRAVVLVAVFLGQVSGTDLVCMSETTQWLMAHSDSVFFGIAGEYSFKPEIVWKGGTRGNEISFSSSPSALKIGTQYIVFAVGDSVGGFSATQCSGGFLEVDSPKGRQRLKDLSRLYAITWRAPKEKGAKK